MATPGGDLGEIIAAAIAWFKLTGTPYNAADVNRIFSAIMERVVTSTRPLYYHTDDAALVKVFQAVQADPLWPIGNEMPSILPDRAPDDRQLRELWISHLSKSKMQGCGHLRLMTSEALFPDYSVSRNGSHSSQTAGLQPCIAGKVADAQCVSSKLVAEQVIKEFYRWVM
eukprot:gene11564-11708_t